MKAVSNRLFSSANKSVKVWDLETMKSLSELPDAMGMTKAITYWKDKNLLITASEKNIFMWDTLTMTNIGTAKLPAAEIRALEVV